MDQIDLDLIHNYLDKLEAEGKSEVYVDEDFESYDRETDELDSQLSDYSEPVRRVKPSEFQPEDWEEVSDGDL